MTQFSRSLPALLSSVTIFLLPQSKKLWFENNGNLEHQWKLQSMKILSLESGFEFNWVDSLAYF